MTYNEELNELVKKYQGDRDDYTFTELYRLVFSNWRNLKAVAKSIKASEAEILAAYEDELLKCIEVYDESKGDFINLLNRYIWRKRRRIYTKKKTVYKYEMYENVISNENDMQTEQYQIQDDFNLEEVALSKKEADQRQLIDSLLSGADETTTAIVETFLQHSKPTPTAIGKQLDIHHSTVIRKLEKLASKFDSKQFGNHTDYLVAL
jgi:hypothetical protein